MDEDRSIDLGRELHAVLDCADEHEDGVALVCQRQNPAVASAVPAARLGGEAPAGAPRQLVLVRIAKAQALRRHRRRRLPFDLRVNLSGRVQVVEHNTPFGEVTARPHFFAGDGKEIPLAEEAAQAVVALLVPVPRRR